MTLTQAADLHKAADHMGHVMNCQMPCCRIAREAIFVTETKQEQHRMLGSPSRNEKSQHETLNGLVEEFIVAPV